MVSSLFCNQSVDLTRSLLMRTLRQPGLILIDFVGEREHDLRIERSLRKHECLCSRNWTQHFFTLHFLHYIREKNLFFLTLISDIQSKVKAHQLHRDLLQITSLSQHQWWLSSTISFDQALQYAFVPFSPHRPTPFWLLWAQAFVGVWPLWTGEKKEERIIQGSA